MIIITVYRQPNDEKGGHPSKNNEFKHALKKLKEVLLKFAGKLPDILMCGDFNLPHAKWPECEFSSGASSEERLMLEELKEFSCEFFLTQFISQPTHKDKNTLDLIFCNNSNLIHSYTSVPTSHSLSHHYLVTAATNFDTMNSEYPKNRTSMNDFDELNFFSENIDWDSVNNEFCDIDWDTEFQNLSPNEILDKFLSITTKISEKYVPKKRIFTKKHIIPKDRRTLMRKRSRINKQIINVKSTKRKEKLHKNLVEIECKIQDSLKHQALNDELQAIHAIKKNPKYFYSYANKLQKVRTKIGPLLNKNGEYTEDSKEMANILQKQYVSIFTTKKTVYSPKNTCTNIIDDINFTEEDIVKAITDISPSSAAGPDGFPVMMLNKCKNSLSKPLHMLWRKSLDTGAIPEILTKGHIIPIFKTGDKGLPENYRPVTLTSQITKLFEKIIRNSIANHLEENNLYNQTQHGFRNGRSCLSQLLEHYDHVLNMLEEGYNVDTIYLDFSKAFDKVNFNVLLKKIQAIGISGKLYDWLHSFLINRKQVVVVNGSISKSETVLSGVPQGTVLGPLLFLIMIMDINEDVKNSMLSSFADDTRVMRGIQSSDDSNLLQLDLNIVYEWANKNDMSFNSCKFELVQYGKNEILKEQSAYKTDKNSFISKKNVVKDLGILMSSDGTFKDHIFNVANRAKTMCSWILRTFQSRSPSLMLTLWKTMVLPILDYCSQLWNPCKVSEIQLLESIQRSYIRKIDGSHNLTYWNQLKKFKLMSLQRRRERYIIIYTWKMLERIVPNIGINCYTSNRRGRVCFIESNKRGSFQSLQHNSFRFAAPRLFNILPKTIRNTTSCNVEKFKQTLNKFLCQIPDEPLITGYTKFRCTNTNSIIDMAEWKCIDESRGGHPWKPYS